MRKFVLGVSLLLIAAFGWYFLSIAINPFENLWEQCRVLGPSFKAFEAINPFFMAMFFLVWGYRFNLEHSRKAADREARAKYFPLEASMGAVVLVFIVVGILLGAAESALKQASTKVEKIILLCDNNLDLQKRYAAMNSKTDYLEFLVVAKSLNPSSPYITGELARNGRR